MTSSKNSPRPLRLGGVLLCGGASSRIGTPKHLLRINGESLLERIARQVAACANPCLIVAAPDQDVTPPAGWRVVHDPQPHEGPLAALTLALEHLHSEVDAVFLAACDLPELSAPFIRAVADCLTDEFEIAVPFIDGRRHPLAAVYRVSVLHRAQQLLATGERSLQSLLRSANTRSITASELEPVDPGLRSLINVNTPGDFLKVLPPGESVIPPA